MLLLNELQLLMLYRHFIHSNEKESMAEIYSYVDGMPPSTTSKLPTKSKYIS